MEMHGKAEEKLKLTESMFAENKTKLSKEIAKTKDMEEQILDRDVELNTHRLIIQDLTEKLQTGANELGESKLLVISLNENSRAQKENAEKMLSTVSARLEESEVHLSRVDREKRNLQRADEDIGANGDGNPTLNFHQGR
jgi:hypothetical protein